MITRRNPWIAFRRSATPPRLRLFCLPHAGGSAIAYRAFAAACAPGIDVCPIELPGRGMRVREAPMVRTHQLVPPLADGIADLLDVPFALYGHSMGALLAFELTRHLAKNHGSRPKCLFVSAMRAAHLPNRHPPWALLEPDELLQRVRGLGGTPDNVWEDRHRELQIFMAAILKADFAVCDNYEYRPAPPLDLPIYAFGGDHDPFFDRDEIEGWRSLTSAAFESRIFPGGHFFINDSLGAVTSIVNAALHGHHDELRIAAR